MPVFKLPSSEDSFEKAVKTLGLSAEEFHTGNSEHQPIDKKIRKNNNSIKGNYGCNKNTTTKSNTEIVKINDGMLYSGFKRTEIPLFNKPGETGSVTIDVLYRILQVGCIRSYGILKDIVPSLKNAVKEEAIQFHCKTCDTLFCYGDIENHFFMDELSCHCPNRCDLGKRISAEFCFKFIVKDLKKTQSTFLLTGKEAEAFFGCTVSDFWHSHKIRHLVRRAIRNLLRSYDRKIISEFCISSKNLFNSGPKYLLNIGKKYCIAPLPKMRS